MTLNDLGPSEKDFSGFFAIFGCNAHFNFNSELQRNA